MVIWIIGKSGSGKSFIAKELFKKIKTNRKIIVDGDEVRKYFTNKLGYTQKDRKKNSIFIQKICKFLEDKNIIVICSILSIFRSHQKRNRKLYKKYIQVLVEADTSTLLKRNNKGIYAKKKNVVGKDIDFPKPYKSHYLIKNFFSKKIVKELAPIAKRLNEQKNK